MINRRLNRYTLRVREASDFRIVLVTVPDLVTGRELANHILEARLAACVNMLPAIESHYWWQGKIEQGDETLLLIKTADVNISALEEVVLHHHPYDTPEFVVLPIQSGNERYLEWIRESVVSRKP